MSPNRKSDRKPRSVQPSTNSTKWEDREIEALAIGLQTYGLAEKQKISELIKTKNENAVKWCIKSQLQRTKAKNYNDCRRRTTFRPWNNPLAKDLEEWPTIRKWRKIAHNQMHNCVKKQDYSRIIMQNLCRRFYEEESEPNDPELVNTKIMYKYMLDCMSGHMPAEMPPLESALMDQLLGQLEEIINTCDFTEEKTFIKDFKKAHTFRPFHIKDEFQKKKAKSEPGETNAIPVVDEVFSDLSRHRKLFQSFNPLVVPLWLLEKEQTQVMEVLNSQKTDLIQGCSDKTTFCK